MDEKALKKAEEALKKGQAELETRIKTHEDNKAEFKKFVAEKEEQFREHVEKTEKRLEEQAKDGSIPFRRPKSCYSDSSTIKAAKLKAEAVKHH